MRKIKLDLYLCYFTIFSFIVLGNAATFNLGNRLPIKVAEVIGIIAIIFIILFNRFKFRFSKYNKKMIIWLIIGTISLLYNFVRYGYTINETIYGFFYTLRIVFLIVLSILTVMTLKKYEIPLEKILDYIIYCYLLVCIIGFFQYAFYPKAYDFYALFTKYGVYISIPDPHIGRLVSTYFDPNFFASCLLLPISMSLILWQKNNKIQYFLSFLVFVITVFLTSSRSGILGIAIILFIHFFQTIKKSKNSHLTIQKRFLTVFIIFILIIPILFFSGKVKVFNRVLNSSFDGSTYARFKSWNTGFTIIKNNPVIGIGYNLMGSYQSKVLGIKKVVSSTGYGNDSSLLLVLITSGIVGFIYFAQMIFSYLISLFKKYKNNSLYYIMILDLTSSIIASSFNNLLFYQLWLFQFLIVANLIEEYNS